MIASDVIELARDTLNDPDGVRWIDTDMLRWLGDALRAVGVLRPAAASKTTALALTPSSTIQSIPADGFMLLDVRRNMGADGLTPGKPVREVDYDALQAFDATWHSASGATVIDNYAYRKDKEPLQFWVSPNVAATPAVYVEVEYAEVWADPDTMADTLPLNEEYKNALSEFVIGKALSIDSDTGDAKYEQHFASFATNVQALIGGNPE